VTVAAILQTVQFLLLHFQTKNLCERMSIVPTFTILFMCIGLAAALSLLSKISPNKLYDECELLSRTKEFSEMIKNLTQKIPILVKGHDDESALWDDINYPKQLSAIKSFIAKVKSHEYAYENYEFNYKHWDYSKISEVPPKRVIAYDEAMTFKKTHRVCFAILY
jgi:hypothetical protein